MLKGLAERVPGSAEGRAGSVGTAATFASAVRSADAAEARVATAGVAYKLVEPVVRTRVGGGEDGCLRVCALVNGVSWRDAQTIGTSLPEIGTVGHPLGSYTRPLFSDLFST